HTHTDGGGRGQDASTHRATGPRRPTHPDSESPARSSLATARRTATLRHGFRNGNRQSELIGGRNRRGIGASERTETLSEGGWGALSLRPVDRSHARNIPSARPARHRRRPPRSAHSGS